MAKRDLIVKVFKALDLDGNGRLSPEEVRPYADNQGFEGTDEDWAEEWTNLVSDYDWDARKGPDEAQFVTAVQDEEGSCFAEDDDLEEFLTSLLEGGEDEAEAEEEDAGGDADEATADRRGMIKRMFKLLDTDGDGHLNVSEMYIFSKMMEYPGSEQEWKEEFASMCAENNWKTTPGISEAGFSSLLDDEEGDLFCEDDQLVEMLAELQESSSKSPEPLVARRRSKPSGRTEQIEALFEILDKNKDGALDEKEMLVFSRSLGFPGSDAEWSEEFKNMCMTERCKNGIDRETFIRLANDKDGDCFLDAGMPSEIIDELGGMPEECEVEAGIRPPLMPERKDYIRALFSKLDVNNDKRLQEKELLPFAKAHIHVPESEMEWAIEFRRICSANSWDPERGLDAAAFQKILDQEDSLCHCDDGRLRTILQDLAPKALESLDNEVVDEGTELVCKQVASIYKSIEDPDEIIGEVQPGEEVIVAAPKVTMDGVNLVSIRIKGRMAGVVELDNFQKKASKQMRIPRKSLLTTAFGYLDVNKDGMIGEPELFRLASLIGYTGSDDDFYDDYKPLCLRYGLVPDDGCNLDQFVELMKDEKSAVFCSADQLEKAIATLSVPGGTQSTKRTPLLHNLFETCDADGDQVLNKAELLRFAKCVGFPGTDEDWEDEYETLCEANNVKPEKGLGFKEFRSIVDDKDSDYNCDDTQLSSMLAAIQWDIKNEKAHHRRSVQYSRPVGGGRNDGRRSNTEEDKAALKIQALHRGRVARERVDALKTGTTYNTCGCGHGFADDDLVCRGCGRKRPRREIVVHCPARAELIKEIFTGLDADGDRRLCKAELLRLAKHCEFSGTDAEWDVEYEALSKDYNWDSKRGVDVKGFVKFVNDKSGMCYCTDDELNALHRDLVVMKGHGPMIDHMNSLLPQIVDSADDKMAALAFRSASLQSVGEKLEDKKLPQPQSITVDSVSDPLKKLSERQQHKDAEKLTAQQVTDQMQSVTKSLRQYTNQSSKEADEEGEYEDSDTSSEEEDPDEEFLRSCSCGYVFGDGQRFCRRCGKERAHAETCENCGVIIDHSGKNCTKCGHEIAREDKELDVCEQCSVPYKDPQERFCRKCGFPRPISEGQCECGAWFETPDQKYCNACGLVRFDEKAEDVKIAKHKEKVEQFEQFKQQKREKSRRSLLLQDNARQEEFDKQQKLRAAQQKKDFEKAEKLPPGALLRAIAESDEQVAMTVIQHPSFNEAHTRDGRGCTALHGAAERGLTNVCRALLMLNGFRDAGTRDNEGWTALHRAARNGHAAAVKCLASHPTLNSPQLARGRDDFTALHCAAIHGFTPAVKMLLDHPKFSEVNAVDCYGRTALHCAATYGHEESVKALLEHQRFTNEYARTKYGAIAKDVATGKAKEYFDRLNKRASLSDASQVIEESLQRSSLVSLGSFMRGHDTAPRMSKLALF